MGILEIFKESQCYKIISKDISFDMLNHTYMLISNDEILINEFAIMVAKTILCPSYNAPCDECVVCNKISHNNYFDLSIYPKESSDADKTARISKDDTVEIIDSTLVRPIDGKYKIVILKNIDESMDVTIQNKLLKTIEEPPSNVIFLLTTTNEYNVLNTVRSRAKKIHETTLSNDVVIDYLVDTLKVDNEKAIKIAAMSSGNLTNATKFSKSKNSLDMLTLIFNMLENMKNSTNVLFYSAKIQDFKELDEFLNILLVVFRDIMVASTDENHIKYTFYMDIIQKLTALYSPKVCFEIRLKSEKAIEKLNANCNKSSVIDGLLFDILEVKYLCQK